MGGSMKTEQMIEKLIEDDILTIKSAMSNRDYEYLYHILADGIGYNSWTDEQVKAEYEERSWELEEEA
jgi:putative AlgH/UPF0301 family transcriptional regulator